MWPLLTVVLLGLITAAILWARHHNNYWLRTAVPHIRGWPFVGNFGPILSMRTGVVQHFQAMYNDERVRNAPVFGAHLFHNPTLFVRDPEIIRQLFVKDFALFSDRYSHSDTHDPLGNLNVLFARNPIWRRLRTRLTPFFSSGKLRQMFGLITTVGAELDRRLGAMTTKSAAVEGVAESKTTTTAELEAKELAACYSTDVIASCAYGVQANSLADPDSDFRRNGRKVFKFNLYRIIEVTSLFFLPELTRLFRFRLFGAETSQFIRSSIEFVMCEREKSQVKRNDLIDTLIQLRDDDKDRVIAEGDGDFRFSGDILIAQATIFFTAGYETTSSTISFGLYELSRHPDVQRRLREEIRTTLAKNGGTLTYDAIVEMEYLHMVVSEVLRMHPVIPFLDRRCTLPAGQKSYSFRPHADFEMSNGMGVIVPIAAMQRDPRFWTNPDLFDPERFAPANKALLVPYTFLPFGCGPRSCLGERFGLLQSKVGFVSFLRNHYVTVSERMGGPMQYSTKAMFIQAEKGIYVNVVHDPLMK